MQFLAPRRGQIVAIDRFIPCLPLTFPNTLHDQLRTSLSSSPDDQLCNLPRGDHDPVLNERVWVTGQLFDLKVELVCQHLGLHDRDRSTVAVADRGHVVINQELKYFFSSALTGTIAIQAGGVAGSIAPRALGTPPPRSRGPSAWPAAPSLPVPRTHRQRTERELARASAHPGAPRRHPPADRPDGLGMPATSPVS